MIKDNRFKKTFGTAKTAPYLQARQALADAVDAARTGKAAPASRATVVLEEAFAILHDSMFGNGLDEEALTAAFMTSLAAASRMWADCWLWPTAEPGELCWIHYNKTSEAKVGADFALLIAAPGAIDSQAPAFRLVVVQAKRQDKAINKLSVTQPTNWAGGAAGQAAQLAEHSLRMLLDGRPGQEIDSTAPHFQLSKLVMLRERLQALPLEDGRKQPGIVYAIWPEDDGEPLYRTLAEAIDDIRAKDAPKHRTATIPVLPKLTQSIKLVPKAKLRHWLITLASQQDGAMSLSEVTAAFGVVNELCSATVVLDLGTGGLGNILKAAVGIPTRPALTPIPAGPAVAKHN
jgi:hypothetical protein